MVSVGKKGVFLAGCGCTGIGFCALICSCFPGICDF